MQDILPNAQPQNARNGRSRPTIPSQKPPFGFLQPGVLPVLALALFVGGWSYGLKLSHYLHNPDVTKASTTRMWVDQKNELIPVPVQHEQNPQEFSALQLSVLALPSHPHLSGEWGLSEAAPPHIAEFISPLHPLRAPPISLTLA